MKATASFGRSVKCAECGIVSIVPQWLKSGAAGRKPAIWQCLACGHDLNANGKMTEKKPPNADRIEEFFARFC